MKRLANTLLYLASFVLLGFAVSGCTAPTSNQSSSDQPLSVGEPEYTPTSLVLTKTSPLAESSELLYRSERELTLTGLTVRFILAEKPQDLTVQPYVVSPELLASGWSVPVNQIECSQDDQSREICSADLALLNVGPEGGTILSNTALVQLASPLFTSQTLETMTFDPSLSLIVTKQSEVINPNFVQEIVD